MPSNFSEITKQDSSEVQKVIDKNQISIPDGTGVISEFEHNFSRYIGRKYCLVQNNGTSTLHAAFFALGLKEGDEVIVPSYTWHSSAAPMLHVGAKPVFCEINPETLTIEPKDILSRINDKTKAIVVVHLFGMPAQMDEVVGIAEKYNLFVVEDCSHAYGTLYKGRKVGTFGDISCFSMQAGKLLGAGEGGIFCTDNKDFFERALILGHHGRLHSVANKEYKKYSYTGIGFKYRANPLSVALANSKLKRIDETNRIKSKNIEHFESLIKEIPGITIVQKPRYCDFRSYYGFRFLYDEKIIGLPKEEFIKKLRKHKILATDEKNVYKLLHKEPIFTKNKFFDYLDEGIELPITEKVHSKVVVVDIPHEPNPELINRYASSIKDILNNEKEDGLLQNNKGMRKKLRSSLKYALDIAKQKNPLRAIDDLTIELTMKCNLRCKMCFQREHRYGNYDNKDFSFDEVKKILYEAKPKKIIISGGEAMVRHDFFDILEILKDLKTRVHLLTSGSMLNEKNIERIKKYDNIERITFSLDYFSPEKHDELRGKKGLYNSIIKAINELKDHFEIGTFSVLLDDNLEDIKNIVDYFSGKGFEVKFTPNEFYSGSEIDETKRRLGHVFGKEAKYIELFCITRDISKEKEDELNNNIKELSKKTNFRKGIFFMPFYLNNTNHLNYGSSKIKGICRRFEEKQVRFDNKGKVIVCEKIREVLGDPKKNSIKEIWNSELYRKLRQDFKENGPLPICKRCVQFKAY